MTEIKVGQVDLPSDVTETAIVISEEEGLEVRFSPAENGRFDVLIYTNFSMSEEELKEYVVKVLFSSLSLCLDGNETGE